MPSINRHTFLPAILAFLAAQGSDTRNKRVRQQAEYFADASVEKLKRRAANKRARLSRKINRQRAKRGLAH